MTEREHRPKDRDGGKGEIWEILEPVKSRVTPLESLNYEPLGEPENKT